MKNRNSFITYSNYQDKNTSRETHKIYQGRRKSNASTKIEGIILFLQYFRNLVV